MDEDIEPRQCSNPYGHWSHLWGLLDNFECAGVGANERTLWYRCFYGALNDPDHGINSLSALEHATDVPARRQLARRAMEMFAGVGP